MELSLCVTTLVALPSGLRITQTANRTSTISQHGITWTFSSDVEFGRFVNGDYWVVGPVTIVNIDPLSTVEGGRTRHGSMINPHRNMTQGYDSGGKSSSFSAANNVGRPGGNTLSAANPLDLQAGDSLVSGRSGEPAGRWPPGQLDDAAVLTVVGEPPPAGAFRPPYTNGSKKYRWNANDIDWGKLEARQVSRSRLGSLPNLSSIAAGVSRVWLDHSESWSFLHAVPANNMPSFGREFQKRVGDVALTLLLDYSQAELEAILYGFLQVGIDLFGLAEQGQTWWANGAIFGGRKLPILFAGWLFDNDVAGEMLDIADAGQNFIFHEDQQTSYVDQEVFDDSEYDYPEAMDGYPEWSIRFHQWRMYKNTHNPNPSWGASYRNNNIGAAGMVLATLIAGLRDEWDHDAIFDYHDRAYAARSGADGNDPIGEHSMWRVQTNGLTSLTYNMWEEFRQDYPPVWTQPD